MKTGFMVEFKDPEHLIHAVEKLREKGYKNLDAYTPYPMHDLEHAMHIPRSPVPFIAGAAAAMAASGAYFLQWFFNAFDYPLNVGGRPPHFSSGFMIVTFEMGILFTGLTAVGATLAFAGLPKLWHPTAEVKGFESATDDGFWLQVASDSSGKSPEETRRELEALSQEFHGGEVKDVEEEE